MSEQQHANRRVARRQDDEVVELDATATGADQGFDDLLDEIDGLLENNAAEYVRSFVQKGGQ